MTELATLTLHPDKLNELDGDTGCTFMVAIDTANNAVTFQFHGETRTGALALQGQFVALAIRDLLVPGKGRTVGDHLVVGDMPPIPTGSDGPLAWRVEQRLVDVVVDLPGKMPGFAALDMTGDRASSAEAEEQLVTSLLAACLPDDMPTTLGELAKMCWNFQKLQQVLEAMDTTIKSQLAQTMDMPDVPDNPEDFLRMMDGDQ